MTSPDVAEDYAKLLALVLQLGARWVYRDLHASLADPSTPPEQRMQAAVLLALCTPPVPERNSDD